MGGFVLPFAERLGRPVPPWDFRVDGVHSISADVHKLGYAPKGVSVILHRTKELRRFQTFVFDGWLGGLYASPNLQGTRSGAPMAAAWAVMRHLGADGYDELTARTLGAADRLRAGIGAIDGVRVLGDGTFHVVAMAAADPAAVDVFAVGDVLRERGWHLDRQGPPDSLHATVSQGNAATIDAYLADLATRSRPPPAPPTARPPTPPSSSPIRVFAASECHVRESPARGTPIGRNTRMGVTDDIAGVGTSVLARTT